MTKGGAGRRWGKLRSPGHALGPVTREEELRATSRTADCPSQKILRFSAKAKEELAACYLAAVVE